MRWLVVLLITLATVRAEAHPIDIGYLRIDVDGPVLTTVLDLDIVAAGQLIRVDPEQLTADAVGAYESRLARATYRGTQIASDAGPCAWAPTGSIRRDKRVVLLTAVATCPGGAPPRTLTWKLAFLDQLPSTFQVFIQAPAFGDQMPILDRAAPQLDLRSAAPERGFLGQLWAGLARLRILDQLVFLLALLLARGAKRPPYDDPGSGRSAVPSSGQSSDPVGGTRRELAGIAGASFAAQVATCALGVAGVLRPPTGLIAPLVAASIIVAAFTAIAAVPHRRRRLAIELACIHGVAIAAAGREAGAGLGFYLGVELAYVAAAVVLMLALAPRRGTVLTFVLGAAACAYASYLILVGIF